MTMKDDANSVPLELSLEERRNRLADALGSLLARAWLREHRPPTSDSQASAAAGLQPHEQAQKPP
jgi:hypothetical protein